MATKSENAEIAVLQEQMETTIVTLGRVEDKIDNLDKKFASRWVQTVVAGAIAAILLAFLGVIINFFIPSRPNVTNNTDINNPAGTSSQTSSTGQPTTSTNTTKTNNTKTEVKETQKDNSNDQKSLTEEVGDLVPKL